MIIQSMPFPTRSSIYFHKNCISSTNSEIRKVRTMGPAKARKTSRVNFFTLYLQPRKIQVQVTNFNFSPAEANAICESNFFLLKSSASQKIIDLFGLLEVEIKKESQRCAIGISEMNNSNGKIFRGENYKLFPYIVLDCPRLFSAKSVFAFRSMFWWGHEFSFTLHLQGEALDKYRNSMFNNINLLSGKEVYYCINDSPWQYNFDRENYIPIENLETGKEEFLTKPFIKISRKLEVIAHEKVHQYAIDSFNLFMKLLNNS